MDDKQRFEKIKESLDRAERERAVASDRLEETLKTQRKILVELKVDSEAEAVHKINSLKEKLSALHSQIVKEAQALGVWPE